MDLLSRVFKIGCDVFILGRFHVRVQRLLVPPTFASMALSSAYGLPHSRLQGPSSDLTAFCTPDPIPSHLERPPCRNRVTSVRHPSKPGPKRAINFCKLLMRGKKPRQSQRTICPSSPCADLKRSGRACSSRRTSKSPLFTY